MWDKLHNDLNFKDKKKIVVKRFTITLNSIVEFENFIVNIVNQVTPAITGLENIHILVRESLLLLVAWLSKRCVPLNFVPLARSRGTRVCLIVYLVVYHKCKRNLEQSFKQVLKNQILSHVRSYTRVLNYLFVDVLSY